MLHHRNPEGEWQIGTRTQRTDDSVPLSPLTTQISAKARHAKSLKGERMARGELGPEEQGCSFGVRKSQVECPVHRISPVGDQVSPCHAESLEDPVAVTRCVGCKGLGSSGWAKVFGTWEGGGPHECLGVLVRRKGASLFRSVLLGRSELLLRFHLSPGWSCGTTVHGKEP